MTYNVCKLLKLIIVSDVQFVMRDPPGPILMVNGPTLNFSLDYDVSGAKLTVILEKDKVKLTDESGNSALVTTADLKGSNGVIHVIDSVVLPK